MMKIYTGTGDRGKTSLFSGERINKADKRIEAYGDVDELNSIIGVLIASIPSEQSDLFAVLQTIQSDLFIIGSWLATTPGSPAMASLEKIEDDRIKFLEAIIDETEARLPELKGFILPGGDKAASWAHVARAVCRRTERRTVDLMEDASAGQNAGSVRDTSAEVDPWSVQIMQTLVYLNRLSDYLFVLARYCNHIQDIADTLWKNKD